MPQSPITQSLFLDWTLLGVDDAGEPVHEPTMFTDNVPICRCQDADCQLDRALYRARVAGFLQALQVIHDGRSVEDVLG